jgi:hypothetical protein
MRAIPVIQCLKRVLLTGILLMPVLYGAPALAELGGDVSTVVRDSSVLGAARVISQKVGFTLHESRTPQGLVVRQYVEASGKVFAVTWAGRQSPNTSALLGRYASRYLAAARAPHSGHHVLTIHAADLELTVMRTQRGWLGSALLPGTLPQGVTREMLR